MNCFVSSRRTECRRRRKRLLPPKGYPCTTLLPSPGRLGRRRVRSCHEGPTDQRVPYRLDECTSVCPNSLETLHSILLSVTCYFTSHFVMRWNCLFFEVDFRSVLTSSSIHLHLRLPLFIFSFIVTTELQARRSRKV